VDSIFDGGHLVFLAVIGLLVYFFPLAIAKMRKIERQNYKRVMMINAFAGWTGIGWLFALIMACACPSTNVDPTVDLWSKNPAVTNASASPSSGDDPRTLALIRALQNGPDPIGAGISECPTHSPTLPIRTTPMTKRCPDCAEEVRVERRRIRTLRLPAASSLRISSPTGRRGIARRKPSGGRGFV